MFKFKQLTLYISSKGEKIRNKSFILKKKILHLSSSVKITFKILINVNSKNEVSK